MKAKCVLDKGLLELIPLLASTPAGEEVDQAMMKYTRIERAMEFIYNLRDETVALPACWRRDMINSPMLMFPLEAGAENPGFEITQEMLDIMVNELLDSHQAISSYLTIEEYPFSPVMVEKLKELYFYLPVDYFTTELMTTYQYAAFAWGLGLPFYTDNENFYAAIHPEAARNLELYDPIPEIRLVYQNGGVTENDLTNKLSWVNLVADIGEGTDQ